ncbi:AEC family transporter [Promicromonospora sukumoe]|uniref:AEC family transporter n=1 Tax=Promicromonospora sukumoe TaxID=88382 RepID=UPI000366D2B1|nr:AEC family transporter [Promicromonospora sukumoe]
MLPVLTAIGSMACVVALGWVIQRTGLLAGRGLPRGIARDGAGDGGAGARQTLATLSFTICAPALMFSTLASTDLAHVLSRGAAVTWITTAVLGLATAAAARWLLRLPAGPAAVTTLAAVYVNGGNIGLPLAVYLFDDALAVVPTLLFQLLVLAPLTLSALDRATASADGPATRSGWRSMGQVFLAAFRNPITLGTVAGLLVAVVSELTGARLPEVVLLPFDLIGAAAPPLGLLTFGMTLAVPMPAADADLGVAAGRGRRLVGWVIAIAVLVRNLLHPLAAWALGSAVGLDAPALALVVTMAALPTAVNVTTYATRYGVFDGVAARATVWTTALCVPVLVVIGALLV